MMKEWLDFVATAASAAVAFVFLFEGTRLLRLHGNNRAPILMVAFGLVYCLAFGGFSYWTHGMINDTLETLEKTKVVDMPTENWGNQVEPGKREEAARTMARMVFVSSGKLPDYVDASGQRKRFSPTEEDIKDRDFRVVTRARLEDAMHKSLRDALGWLIWASVAVALGFIFGSHRKPTPANPTLEDDARKSGARGSP